VLLIEVNTLVSPVLIFVTFKLCALPLLAAIFSRVTSLTNLEFVKRIHLIVSLLCLNPKREPAIFNILYSGFKRSREYCSLLIRTEVSQYSKISKLKLEYPYFNSAL